MTKLTLLQNEYRNNVLKGINMKNMQTTHLNQELKRAFPDIEGFEPELFRNFITYWLMRKSNSLNSTNTLKEIKVSNPTEWLGLIQANHKFKSLYGEDIAKTLIELIEEENES